MCPLIPTDQLIREGQPRHEASFLQPEDGGKRPREEDAFYTGERDEPHAEWLNVSSTSFYSVNLPSQE
jgi:hypothetical protein